MIFVQKKRLKIMITFAMYVTFLAAALAFSVGFYLFLNRVVKLI